MIDMATRRMSKRMAAVRRKHGACAMCQFRDVTDGITHCRGNRERAMGMCNDDGRLPQFRVDINVLEGFRDAN